MEKLTTIQEARLKRLEMANDYVVILMEVNEHHISLERIQEIAEGNLKYVLEGKQPPKE